MVFSPHLIDKYKILRLLGVAELGQVPKASAFPDLNGVERGEEPAGGFFQDF
jgi:hypothetical protein